MAGTLNARTSRAGTHRTGSLAGPLAGPLVAAAALCAALAGCASTDELYAEYDAELCPVVAAPIAGPERVVERARHVERGSGDEVRWPPAIYFGYDGDALDRWALAELGEAVRLLTRHPRLNVMLTGYTSRLGSRDYNAELAVRRVGRIVDHLAGAGIERARVLAMPVGMGLPDFTADERVANAVNRRVGLALLDVAGRPISPDYMTPTLEAARRRVGSSWPPNEVPADARGAGIGVPSPVVPPLVVPAEVPAAALSVDPIPGPVDPWATGGAGEIGPRATPAGGGTVGNGRGGGADVR